MDATAALIIVGVLLVGAIVAAAGGFDRPRRVRRTVVERPVAKRRAGTVVEERRTRRIVE
jgi:hypothetical protein